MNTKVNLSVNIVPFGNITYKSSINGKNTSKKTDESNSYTVPLTTGFGDINISFRKGSNYIVPETTI